MFSLNLLDREAFILDALDLLDNSVNPLEFYEHLGAKRSNTHTS